MIDLGHILESVLDFVRVGLGLGLSWKKKMVEEKKESDNQKMSLRVGLLEDKKKRMMKLEEVLP